MLSIISDHQNLVRNGPMKIQLSVASTFLIISQRIQRHILLKKIWLSVPYNDIARVFVLAPWMETIFKNIKRLQNITSDMV